MSDEPKQPPADATPGADDPTTSDAAQVADRPGAEDAGRTGGGRHSEPWVARFLRHLWSGNPVTVTALAIVLALLVGAVLIVISDEGVRETYTYLFARPGDALAATWEAVWEAYSAMFRGAIFDPAAVGRAIDGTGTWATVLRPLSETLTNATPLVFTGLAFAIAFRGGLFNIGGQGQAVLGAIGAGLAGFLLPLPYLMHLLVALVAAAVAGGLWGFIPGILKARTGAHEVISTIMLNAVAGIFIGWLLIQTWVKDPDRQDPISRPAEETARLPRLLGWVDPQLRVHLGLLLAVAAVAGVAWLLNRSRLGFELRAVGLNPHAARTAGMSVTGTYVTVMVIAGALAGLGGATIVLGTAASYALTALIIGNAGFDGILVGLLGRAKPWGVLAAALLFGALQAGGRAAQSQAGISLELVTVLQALIVIFVAAPALVKATFRLREVRVGGVAEAVGRGW